ncbi:MAG: fimbria/pilus periplasmic chaperone [Verrucomicrobiae bacterium]|nr:fimbria/pilus periplasmic chaperone [Verrucomicrobiae bacterium]
MWQARLVVLRLRRALLFYLLMVSGLFRCRWSLDAHGKGAATNFRIENASSTRIAFQVSVLTCDLDEDGRETNRPANELFNLFPRQGILEPGAKQTIRVVWRGPSNPEREQAYRLVAEQLTVDFAREQKRVHIQILLRYMAAVYVRPKNAKPILEVIDCSRTPTNTYVLSVTNKGNGRYQFRNPRLQLTDSFGKTYKVPAEILDTLQGSSVFPHRRRRFILNLPGEFTEQSYTPRLLEMSDP